MSVPEEAAARRSTFAPETIDSGAVVSFDGASLVTSGEEIIAAVEAGVRTASSSQNQRAWPLDGIPTLSRGEAWIVPLFWLPPSAHRDQPRVKLLDQRGSELGQSIMSACWFRHGDPVDVKLDEVSEKEHPYAAALARTGARSAAWWGFGDSAVVLVYYGDRGTAGKSKMALHVIPVGWVSRRRPTNPKKIAPLDLSWSWADVVEFAAG